MHYLYIYTYCKLTNNKYQPYIQLHSGTTTTRISHLSRNYRVIYVKMPKYNIGVCTDLLHIHREPPILHFYVYTIYYAYCCTQSQQQHDILLYNLLLEKKVFLTPSANFDVETWNHTEAKLTHSISCILFNLLLHIYSAYHYEYVQIFHYHDTTKLLMLRHYNTEALIKIFNYFFFIPNFFLLSVLVTLLLVEKKCHIWLSMQHSPETTATLLSQYHFWNV